MRSNESTLGGSPTLASISSSSVTQVAGLHDVAAAAGGLTLTDRTLTGTMSAINFNGGGPGSGDGGGGSGGGFHQFRSSFTPGSFGVDGVDLSVGELGPLSSGKLASGRTFAVLLAVAGGLIAGTFGGWRAARLRPAAALAKVG